MKLEWDKSDPSDWWAYEGEAEINVYETTTGYWSIAIGFRGHGRIVNVSGLKSDEAAAALAETIMDAIYDAYHD